MRSASSSHLTKLCGFITVEFLLETLRLCPTAAAQHELPDSLLAHPSASSADDVESLVEGVLGAEMDPELLARLVWLTDHPIDLNEASAEDFLAIPGLPSADVEAIQHHRRTHGRFKDAFDIAGIAGVTAESWRLLRPFVTVTPQRQPLTDLRMRCNAPIRRFPEAGTAALGSDVSSYGRIILSPASGWESGLVAASGPGERLADGFLTGYVKFESAGLLRRVIVGDFSVASGEGLMWGQGMRPAGFHADRNANFSPHRSASEQGFLRGAGLTAAVDAGSGELRAHVLASRVACAAMLDSNDEVTSLSAVSTYNTESLLLKRNALHLSSLGARLEFLGAGNVRLGLTGMRHWFDHSLTEDGFGGLEDRDYRSIGADGAMSIGPIRCAVECAMAGPGTGYAATLSGTGGHGLEMQILLRRCTPDCHSLLAVGGSFGEQVRNTSEVRWMIGLSPFQRLSVRAEIAQFRKLGRTARIQFPTGGREILVESTLRWVPGFQLTLRGEERWTEHKIASADGPRSGFAFVDEPRRRIQCTGNLTRGSRWQLRGRFELVRFLNMETGADESGWLVMGDIRWEPCTRFQMCMRMTLFKTDSYASRMYVTEANAEGFSGATVLEWTGRRWYCLVSAKPLSMVRMWVRYATTDIMGGIRRKSTDSQLTAQIDFQIGKR
jgi:hypothetical protein